MSLAPFAPALIVASLLAAGAGLLGPAPPGRRHQAQDREPRAELHSEAPPAAAASTEELVVPPESVLGLQLETAVSRPGPGGEEPVYARLTRDVMVGGRVAVPAGSRVLGWAWLTDKDGKHKEPGDAIELVFTSLELPGGERLDIVTEPVARDAGTQAARMAAPGTAGGAVIGALLRGSRTQRIPPGSPSLAPAAAEAVELRAGSLLSVRTQSEFRVKVAARR